MNAVDFFYYIKPVIPKSFQLFLRRALALKKKKKSGKFWPIWPIAGQAPNNWKGWPNNKQFALVLIHDVDTREGLDNCLNLMDLEIKRGFRSALYFVPKDYNTPDELRQQIVNSGFEIGLHGLTHNGKFYRNYRVFSNHIKKINAYLKEWRAVGYTSPSMLGNLTWNTELNIEYSCSSFDTDPFEPRPFGVATIFPFFVRNPAEISSYVEIPYTLPQDYSLFILLREKDIGTWKRKLDWVAEKGGVALVNTHPDYMIFDGDTRTKNKYSSRLYADFLDYISSRYRDKYWNSLPKDLARFWRSSFPEDAIYSHDGADITSASRVAIYSKKAKFDWSIKIALTCAAGGHFEQMLNLKALYSKYPHFWITVKTSQTKKSPFDLTSRYFVTYAHFKRPWTYIQQIPQVFGILTKEKPTHIISTGSGVVAFIPFLLSRLLKIKFIHIETFSYVNHPTKLGKLLLRFHHPFFSQWESLNHKLITHIGPIISKSEQVPTSDHSKQKDMNDIVFVTVGTRPQGFPRLLQTVDTLVKENIIREQVVVQKGSTDYQTELMQTFDFCSPVDINRYIASARYIITQESAGIVTKCLKAGKRFIIMPRDYKYQELPTKSDMNEDLHFKLAEMGFTYVVHDKEQLKEAILNIDQLKTGFDFDNSRALAYLTKLLLSE